MALVIRQSVTVGNSILPPPALHPRDYWEPRSGQGPTQREGELEYSYTNFHLSWNREPFQEKLICQHFQHALHTEEIEWLQKKKKFSGKDAARWNLGRCAPQQSGQKQDTEGGTKLKRLVTPFLLRPGSYPGQLLSVLCKSAETQRGLLPPIH